MPLAEWVDMAHPERQGLRLPAPSYSQLIASTVNTHLRVWQGF